MMTITGITQAAIGMSRATQRLHEYHATAKQTVSPELHKKLEQYGVSVHFSPEAEAYRSPPEHPTAEPAPPIPLWNAIFKKLGLV